MDGLQTIRIFFRCSYGIKETRNSLLIGEYWKVMLGEDGEKNPHVAENATEFGW
jgi:hypothetical protein